MNVKLKKHLGILLLFPMLFVFHLAIAQQSISGSVADENGQGLSGATVSLQGTTKGTFTDNQGKFTITASPQDVLVVSYLGV